MPYLKDFIEIQKAGGKGSFANLKVRLKQGADAKIYLYDSDEAYKADKRGETVPVGNWKGEHLDEFLKERLA